MCVLTIKKSEKSRALIKFEQTVEIFLPFISTALILVFKKGSTFLFWSISLRLALLSSSEETLLRFCGDPDNSLSNPLLIQFNDSSHRLIETHSFFLFLTLARVSYNQRVKPISLFMDSCGNSGFSGVVNGGFSSGFAGLDLMNMNGEPLGVRSIFKPTDEELVAGYLYNKIYRGPDNGLSSFPELEIYGEKGMEPWVIWSIYEGIKCPHQDYIYFFSNLKKLGKPKNNKKLAMGDHKPRWSRTVGAGGTWSETEPSKPINIHNNPLLFGRFRKFRYEHKNKDFIHHAEWLMEEYTLENTSSDLALCRMKKNDGERGRKRKNRIDSVEEFAARNTKSLKLQNMQSPNSDAILCIEHQSYLSKEMSEAIGAVDEYTQATSNEDQLELVNLLEEELASNDQIPPLQDVESEQVNNNELHYQFDPGKHEQSSNEGDGLHQQQQIVPLFQQEPLLCLADQLLNFDEGETDLQLSEEKLKAFWDGLGI